MSKSRRLVIILGTSLLSGIVGVAGLATYFTQSRTFYAPSEMITKAPASGIGETGTIVGTAQPILLYLSVGLIAIAVVGFGFYLFQKSNLKV